MGHATSVTDRATRRMHHERMTPGIAYQASTTAVLLLASETLIAEPFHVNAAPPSFLHPCCLLVSCRLPIRSCAPLCSGGGECYEACWLGMRCASTWDCRSKICTNGLCTEASTCYNGVKDGNEKGGLEGL